MSYRFGRWTRSIKFFARTGSGAIIGVSICNEVARLTWDQLAYVTAKIFILLTLVGLTLAIRWPTTSKDDSSE